MEVVRSSKVTAGAAVAGALLFVSPASAEDSVAVITASPASEEAARYLASQTDLTVVRRTSINARNLGGLLQEARAAWREPLVVVLDADFRVVSVLRPEDGTISSRALAPSAAAAPYVVAVAAAELLDLVQHAPSATPGTVSEGAPPPLGTLARLVLDAGILQTVAASGQINLLQPTAGVDFMFARRGSTLWLGGGVHASGLGQFRREQTLTLQDGATINGAVEYTRSELSLRVLLSHRDGRIAATAWSDLGFAFVKTEAFTSDRLLSTDRRQALWLGLGAEFRYSLVDGLSLGLGVGAGWFPVTSQFYASPPDSQQPVLAFEESSFDLRVRASLGWETNL
jgi:hypothetical protein